MFGTIAELRIGLLRLVGTIAADPELVERGEALNAALDDALLVGVYNTMIYLIDVGAGDDWIATAALTFGAVAATGERTASEPADFLRFAGDKDYPALYDGSTGHSWGQLLRAKRKRRWTTGDCFWRSGGSIVVAPLANVPSSVYLDYYKKLALPTGSTVIGIAEPARPLIVAEAAYHAMHEYWVPKPEGVDAVERRLLRNRASKRTEAAAALRADDGRQYVDEPQPTGSHWWMN